MLKEKRSLFELLFLASDLVVVTFCWPLAYYLRFQLNLPAYFGKAPPFFDYYLPLVLLIVPIWAIVFRTLDLYRSVRGTRLISEILTLIRANLLATIIFMAVVYLLKEKQEPISRLVFLYFGLLSLFFSLFYRMAFRSFCRELRRKGYNLRFLLLIGDGQAAKYIAERVRRHKELGIQLIGCVGSENHYQYRYHGDVDKLSIIGNYGMLPQILRDLRVDQIIVALPLDDYQNIEKVMKATLSTPADVKVVPDYHQFVTLQPSLGEFEGIPVFNVQDTPLYGVGIVFKRITDLLLSIFGLLVLSPLFLVISLLIWITDGRPIFYRQQRLSLDGRAFKMLKFRSMRQNADPNGWTTANDSRVTKLGKFLRCSSLDELPQIINVIKGEMSLVGPRPERPIYVEEFRKSIPLYMLRHKVPCGLTGWAQINGWRGDTSIEERIKCDLYYIKNWSYFLDLKILVLTILKGFYKNAY